MVCGDMGSWARKHTGTADEETVKTIQEQIANAHMYYNQLCSDKEAMKGITLNKRKQAQLLGILFAEYQILTTEQASIVRQQMDRPSLVYVDSNSLWAFYNFVTIALQHSHPKTWMEEFRRLHCSTGGWAERITRKEVLTLLLLARKHCKTCHFHLELFPLDLFKHILALSEICNVITWMDRSIRNLPRDMQFLIQQEPDLSDIKCVKNVVLKGSFRLQYVDFDYIMIPFCVDHFVKTDSLKPVYTESDGFISIRWDDPENLEWWCEFCISPMGAFLYGRIPRDTKCLGFTNYNDRDLRWTFGSDTDSTFWADVYIYN